MFAHCAVLLRLFFLWSSPTPKTHQHLTCESAKWDSIEMPVSWDFQVLFHRVQAVKNLSRVTSSDLIKGEVVCHGLRPLHGLYPCITLLPFHFLYLIQYHVLKPTVFSALYKKFNWWLSLETIMQLPRENATEADIPVLHMELATENIVILSLKLMCQLRIYNMSVNMFAYENRSEL